ncbi:DUF4838 domain-containing protein [Paenibacillus sp. KQZ6P-2]|uniref:DUF4838 domain-containing protein n=1 Tax=Paenibacillus mangrovi TaxID=2931978 RepID=A0A9X2B6U9_9BACL|nr:DUF4838 domain-containing protein [Paenibacillus mangrovi]MCJ8014192.1 DUF4838 domain-containing protein [Paenibacillus mangrovi]
MNNEWILVDKGATNWTIVVGEQASPSEIYAGSELQKYLQEISGVTVPIKNDEGPVSANEIVVGFNLHMSDLASSIDFERLGNDGFVIRTIENRIVIAGGALRGTLYGVYTFLESFLGCRWFSSTVSRIPKRSRISVGNMDIEQVPVLEYREPFFFCAFDGDWAARNKSNGNFPNLEERHGGKTEYTSLFVHTFDHFIPVKEHFDTHPEYFSEVNGERIADRTQLCLTHPDVLDLMIVKVKEYLDQHPETRILSVSQNDWYNPCQCEACRAVDDHEGSYSGSLIHFVNKVAEAIEQDYPEVAIDTLAYQYTRKPPKFVRPRHNVIVRLCSIECCFAHPLETCQELASFRSREESGASFAQDLIGWGKVCERVYIWDYVTNFSNYVMPFPNIRVLQPNIQFFIRNHVKGIFEQGSYEKGGGGEFAELRAYVISKLLWDPEYNVDIAINEFLTGYYGIAAAPLRQYIDMLHDKVEQEHIHTGIYDPPTSEYLSKELIEKSAALFDRAEILADNEEIAYRIHIARLPIRYVQLSTMPKDVPNRQELIDQFFADVRAAGITALWEGRSLEKSKQLMEEGTVFVHA